MSLKVDEIYDHFKNKRNLKYDEEKHCKLLINVMMDRSKGCHTYFCTEGIISEATFYVWVREHSLFGDLYYFCKMIAKQVWYEEGIEIKSKEYQMGTMNYEMEHWKLIGWAKFGISKNSRLKINVNPTDSPAKHYEMILRQAAEGDFTAAEFKQLMEAVNVGINVHQLFELQKQIDELKSDMNIMSMNNNVKNPFSDKGNKKAD
jgi:hypothetical protein